MFEGFLNAKLINAKGLRDEDFKRAIREKRIDDLLDSLPVDQHIKCSNRIFDNVAGYLLDMLFQLGDCAWPYYTRDSGADQQAMLAFVCLLTTSGETTSYTEDYGQQSSGGFGGTDGISNAAESVAGAGNYSAKRFEEDQITGWEIAAETGGREAIYFRNRILWLPSQAVSSAIRSLGIYFSTDADANGLDYYDCLGRIGRVRLRDGAGTPVTLNKTSNQVFLIEYTFSVVSQ